MGGYRKGDLGMVKSAPAGISGSASFNLCANCPSSRLVCGYSGTHLQPADAAKLPPAQTLIAPASAASTLLPLVFSLFVIPDKLACQRSILWPKRRII